MRHRKTKVELLTHKSTSTESTSSCCGWTSTSIYVRRNNNTNKHIMNQWQQDTFPCFGRSFGPRQGGHSSTSSTNVENTFQKEILICCRQRTKPLARMESKLSASMRINENVREEERMWNVSICGWVRMRWVPLISPNKHIHTQSGNQAL